MRHLLLALIFFTVAPAWAQDDIRVEDVHFHRGTSSAVINGSITGYDAVDYHLGAEAGQQMHVLLDTDNGANYFNVLPPGSTGEAIFIGSTEGNEWSGTLAESGTYTVRIYLMRSAARRDERANYAIEFSITGEGDGSPPVAASAWPRDTDASGMLPCTFTGESFDRSAFSMNCDFRVKRNPFGATIWAMAPGDRRDPANLQTSDLRTIYFESDAFSTDDASEVKWDRVEDNWIVKVGEGERYWIPDAVITGG
jgi:hypothetical protein